MIPSITLPKTGIDSVYQRGLVIDSQLVDVDVQAGASISKGIGD